MTPEKKAKELIHKYLQVYDGRVIQAKQCALIAVDEIIKQFVGWYNKWKELHPYMLDVQDTENYKYWQQVAREINNL